MRRIPLAFVILGVLGLLAAGGLVLGVVQSPTPTDLQVHNGAGETLLAGRVTGSYRASNLKGEVISFDFTAPDRATVVATKTNGTVAGRQNVHGTQATGVLEPVRALLSIHHFTERSGVFRSIEPAANLVAPNLRSQVTGTYEVAVRLGGGYVVQVNFRLNATEQGRHVHQTISYRLTRIDAWTRS